MKVAVCKGDCVYFEYRDEIFMLKYFRSCFIPNEVCKFIKLSMCISVTLQCLLVLFLHASSAIWLLKQKRALFLSFLWRNLRHPNQLNFGYSPFPCNHLWIDNILTHTLASVLSEKESTVPMFWEASAGTRIR